MGSSTQTQKTSSQTNPWAGSIPALNSLVGGAQNLYDTGQGFNPYGSSTVAPFSSQTTQALGQIQNIAGQPDTLGAAANQNAQNVIQSGGLNPAQWNALSGTYGVATGQNGINTGGQYQGLFNQAGQPGAIGQNLGGYASGQYVNGGSPEFNAALDRQSAGLANDISRQYSNMGRYGSTSHTNDIGSQVGNFRNDAMSQELQREQAQQLQAAGMLSGEQNQGFNNQFAALGGATGVQGQNIGNMLNAGQGFNGAVNQGQQLAGQYTGMVPTLYDQQFAGANKLGQVGTAYDTLSQAQLSDLVAQQQQAQNAPWNRLNAFGNVAMNVGQLGNTTKGTTSATTPFNPLAAVGGLASNILPFFA